MAIEPRRQRRGQGGVVLAPTTIRKHSVVIAGHGTSISLEVAFWHRLKAVAASRGTTVAALVAAIDAERGEANLSSAIRVFLLDASGTVA